VISYADQNRNVYNPLDVLLFKLANLQRIRNAQMFNLEVEMCIPWLGSTARPSEEKLPRTRVSEFDILRSYARQTDAGWIDPRVYTCRSEAEVVADATWLVALVRGAPMQPDRFFVNLGRLSSAARPLIARMPWEFQEDLLRFKREYVLQRSIECPYLIERDRTIRHTVPAG
jgi:hypothetical protein